MSRAHKRGSNGHEEGGHDDGERWLVSYADMLTVLVGLFIVLYAMSNVDSNKYIELKHSLAEGFGRSSESTVFEGGESVFEHLNPTVEESSGEGIDPADPIAPPETVTIDGIAYDMKDVQAAEAEYQNLTNLAETIEDQLEKSGMGNMVEYRVNERGLAVGMVANEVFFKADGTELSKAATKVLDTIGKVLKPIANEVLIEGHANSLQTVKFASNWELSSERATNVVRRLNEHVGIPAKRLAAVGYSSARPLIDNNTAEGLEANRRVDLTVLSEQPERVRELIPMVAEALKEK